MKTGKRILKRFEDELEMINKAFRKSIRVKIEIPEGVDEKEFERLKDNPEFKRELRLFMKRWIEKHRSETDE